MSFRNLFSAAAPAAVIVVLAASAGAAPVDLTAPGTSATIAQVLAQPGPDAGKFIVFDKVFEITAFTPAAGAPASFQSGNVTIVGRNNGNDGVGFRLFGQWADLPGDAGPYGFTIVYNATVLDDYAAQGVRIAGVNLAFNGASGGTGSVASVDESVFSGQSLLGNARVESLEGNAPTLSAVVPLESPLVTVNVIKDFKVFAPSPTGFATTSFIEQTFKQIVPTPGTAVIAMAGLGMIARRRRTA